MSPLLPLLGHAAGGAEGYGFWERFIALPPLHPILVNFTAALLPAAFLSDLLGKLLGKKSLTSAGWWMLLYGAVVTPLTALAGWLWLKDMGDMQRGEMLVHQWLGTSLALLFIPLTLWRWRLFRTDQTPGPLYLTVAGVVVAVLTLQGHLGGMMSFGEAESGQPRSMNAADPPAKSAPHEQGYGQERQDDRSSGWKRELELKD